jgi:hypothetical protein
MYFVIPAFSPMVEHARPRAPHPDAGGRGWTQVDAQKIAGWTQVDAQKIAEIFR